MQITEEIKKLAVRNNKNGGILQAYREMKKVEAEARAEARSKLTPVQQMDVLNSKFEPGKGAKKERARLLRQMKEMGYSQETINKYRFAGRDMHTMELPIANNPGIGNHEKRIEKFQKRSK